MVQANSDDDAPNGLAAALLGYGKTQNPYGSGLGAVLSGVSPRDANPNLGGSLISGSSPDGNSSAGSSMPDEQSPVAAPMDDSGIGELAKTLAQLYEAGKFRSGYLSKISGAVSYARLSAGAANDTIVVGLRDIDWYENSPFHDHQPQQEGSLIDWRQVDWSKYGADEGVPPETVMRKFLISAMNPGD